MDRKFYSFTRPETFMGALILMGIGFGVAVSLLFSLTDAAYKSVVAPLAIKGEAIASRLTDIEIDLGLKRKHKEIPPEAKKK